MEGNNGIVSTGETVPAVWALDKVVDPWGNFYEIHYNDDKDLDSDFQERGLIVTSIDYTGHMDLSHTAVERMSEFNASGIRSCRRRSACPPSQRTLVIHKASPMA